MQEMINSRRTSEKRETRNDLFTLLLDANMDEGETEETKLVDSELIGIVVAPPYALHNVERIS